MKYKILISALPVILAASCDFGKVYEDCVRLPEEGWKHTEVARFEAAIDDTAAECNIYVNVRNNTDYKWMELWLFVNTKSPSGKRQRDTLKVMITDERGKWLGHGRIRKFGNSLLLGRKIRFPETGVYTFDYEHGMRDDPLTGIEDVGLRIERCKP
ncbi:MAG: gliding motility lipoprotein GldH [Bacteroidales bacterium]|jgi:gliding motility-associated lipoprotein GldH|nr:gliding motility lipoprotein GldH [Bacteroidales bacterium]